MKRLINYLFVGIFLLVILFAFSASYTYDNIDNLAYVIAIGVDSSEENGKIKVSFQFTDTSGYSDKGSSNSSSSIINTVEASSLESAVNLINSYVGKNINLAHCKVIVFSEAIAQKGLYDHIYSLINNSQIRPTSNIVISRCDAKYYIENSVSQYEKIITKYYEVFPNSATYTGYTSDVTLGEFFNQMVDKTGNATAILGGVNTNTSQNIGSNQQDNDILANESSIIGERGTENIGLAVFKGGTLVGELTALDSLCHSIIINEVNTFLISVPDPKDNEKTIDISVSPYKKTKIHSDTSNRFSLY